MTTSNKTEAQLAADKAILAAKKKEEKEAAKTARDAAKAAEKAKEAEAKAAEKLAKEEAKKAAIAAKEAEKEAKKAAIMAAKETSKMPESNGVRRPKPETLCGQAWAVFDEVSAKRGSPASIKESLEIAKARNLNEGNVRCEYARWRKYFGVGGHIAPPAPPAEPSVAPAA